MAAGPAFACHLDATAAASSSDESHISPPPPFPFSNRAFETHMLLCPATPFSVASLPAVNVIA